MKRNAENVTWWMNNFIAKVGIAIVSFSDSPMLEEKQSPMTTRVLVARQSLINLKAFFDDFNHLISLSTKISYMNENSDTYMYVHLTRWIAWS